VINSNLGFISRGFRDMAGFPLTFLSSPVYLIVNLKMFSLHYIVEISHARV